MTNHCNKYLIIPAGGSGIRMGGYVPKQFIEVLGIPIIIHTLRAVSSHFCKVIIAMNSPYIDQTNKLIQQHLPDLPYSIVPGGANRYESVKSALMTIDDPDSIVAIHDSVRPMVSATTIEQVIKGAIEYGAAIPYIKMVESLRQMNEQEVSCAIDRDRIIAIRTPQAFNCKQLQAAYLTDYCNTFTDDCSVYENMYGNQSIALIADTTDNIKITHPVDLMFFKAFLNHNNTLDNE